MGKKLKEYIIQLQKLLESGENIENIEELKKELLVEIGFWQHERFIHLLVTVLFALMTLAVFMILLFYRQISMLILLIALLSLMIPYIRHYYILENGVQTLYVFYERLLQKKPEEGFPRECIPQLEGVVIKPLRSEAVKKTSRKTWKQ